MKKLNYIHILIAIVILFQSCYKDHSLFPDKAITTINITTDARDTLNFFLGDMIHIKTDPSSTTQGNSYQWSLGVYSEDFFSNKITTVFKEIATTSDLEYKTTGLGHYYLRQIITNDHGSAIKYYHVFVNAEYGEGYLILSKRPDGTGNISFMRKLTPEEIAQGKQAEFRQNLFEYVNGESGKIGEGPVDIDKIGQQLFILSKEARKVYHIDNRSFKLQYTYDFLKYASDFVPLNLISYDDDYLDELIVNSANGGTAIIQRSDLEIFPYTELPQNLTFDRSYDRPNSSSSVVIAYINSASGDIWAKGFNMNNMSFEYFPVYNFFKGSTVKQVFYNEEGEMVAVYQKEGVTKVAKIPAYLHGGDPFMPLYDRTLSNTADVLTKDSQIIVNDIYSCLFFSHGAKLYKWHYNQDNVPGNAFIQTPPGENIKYMNQSEDQKQLFVATYNEGKTGSKGSLYIYNSDTGVLMEKHEGVADEPIKVFYKKR